MIFGELDMILNKYEYKKNLGFLIVLAAALPPVEKVGLMTEQIREVVGVVRSSITHFALLSSPTSGETRIAILGYGRRTMISSLSSLPSPSSSNGQIWLRGNRGSVPPSLSRSLLHSPFGR